MAEDKTGAKAPVDSPWPRHVEVDGIGVDVSIDPGDDYELAELMVTRMDPDLTPYERSVASVRYNRLLLGDAYDRVKGALRERNGGRLPNSAMLAFANEVVRQVTALKN